MTVYELVHELNELIVARRGSCEIVVVHWEPGTEETGYHDVPDTAGIARVEWDESSNLVGIVY